MYAARMAYCSMSWPILPHIRPRFERLLLMAVAEASVMASKAESQRSKDALRASSNSALVFLGHRFRRLQDVILHGVVTRASFRHQRIGRCGLILRHAHRTQ